MKYETLLGAPEKFTGHKEDAEILLWHDFLGPKALTQDEMQSMSERGQIPCGAVIIAIRRIIKEPKRWTWEDKKAGRLPEVGCDIQYIESQKRVSVIAINSNEVVLLAKSNGSKFFVLDPDSLLQYYNPVETTAEKAQREEDEWVNKAWSETAVFAGVTQDEHDRLRIHLRHIYRAQISGELAAPKGGE